MGLCKLCTQLLLNNPPLPFFFLPSFPPQLPFLTFSPRIQLPCPGSFHKVPIEAREKGSAAAAGRSFLQGRYRGAGSSLHERAPTPPAPFSSACASAIHQGPTLSGAREHREKGGITLFSLCTPHSYTSVPKASANELASAALWVEREAGLWGRKGLINMGSFSSLMERQSCVH